MKVSEFRVWKDWGGKGPLKTLQKKRKKGGNYKKPQVATALAVTNAEVSGYE